MIHISSAHQIAFACLRRHKARVAESGLELQLAKTKAYIHASHKKVDYHTHRAGIEEGYTINTNGTKSYGIKVHWGRRVTI